ncbi:MAG TPA: hypothetical protein VIM65_14345 [Cyclobacteriaceae bacterium]
MKKLVMIMMLAFAGASGVAFAQTPSVVISDKTGWHKLGETTIDFKKEKDEISVVGADKFAAIKFKVLDESIDLVSAEIFYESGDNQIVNINSHVNAPGDSRQVDLNGGERAIKKISFVYKTLPNAKDKKAHLEVWGLKTNEGSN